MEKLTFGANKFKVKLKKKTCYVILLHILLIGVVKTMTPRVFSLNVTVIYYQAYRLCQQSERTTCPLLGAALTSQKCTLQQPSKLHRHIVEQTIHLFALSPRGQRQREGRRRRQRQRDPHPQNQEESKERRGQWRRNRTFTSKYSFQAVWLSQQGLHVFVWLFKSVQSGVLMLTPFNSWLVTDL